MGIYLVGTGGRSAAAKGVRNSSAVLTFLNNRRVLCDFAKLAEQDDPAIPDSVGDS